MARNNETTTRFNVDISELKSQFSEAQRRVKLAVSEFNAATSSMKDWEHNADGLSAKIKQLNSTYDAENDKLEALKKQLELVVAEQGEGSKAAQDLQIRINNQQATVNRTAEALKDYERQLKDLESGSSGAETSLGKLTKEIDKQEKELADLKDKYKNVVLEQGATSSEAKELEAKIKALSGELKDNRDTLQNAADAADDLDQSLEEVEESSKSANGAFDTMRVALGNLIAQGIQKAIEGLIEFTKLSIETGMNFDSSMSKVSAVSGATGDELQALRDKAKEMGATTMFSATEASEAMQYMAMAGWKSGQMIDGISGIMDLAAASGENLATTSDIVTDALTAFGMSAEDSGHFADVLATASSNANTNVSMMGETFKYVAPVAGTLGYSVDDAAFAIGLMANSGVKASDAGTALRKGLLNLVAPASTASDEMKKLGFYTEETVDTFSQQKIDSQMLKVQKSTLSVDKAQTAYNKTLEKYGEESDEAEQALMKLNITTEQLRMDQEKLDALQKGEITTIYGYNQAIQNEDGSMKTLRETIDFLRENLSGLDEAEQAAAAAHIFGTNAVSGMLAVVNAGADDYDKLSAAIESADGTAKAMSETMQDNLAGDMTLLKSQLEGIRIEFYEKLEPLLREGVAWISENLPDIVDKVYEVAGGVKHTIETIEKVKPVLAAVGTAIAGLALMGVIGNISQIGTMLTAWAAKNKIVTATQWLLNGAMSANPIGFVIIAIAALVAAFVVLWKKSEKFRNFWIGLWENIKEATSGAIDWLKSAFESVAEFFTVTIPETFNTVLDFLKNNWQSILKFLVNPWVGGFDLLYNNSEGFKEFVDNFVQKVSDFFSNLPRNIGKAIGSAVAHVVKFGIDLLNFAKTEVPKFIDKTVSFFKELPEKIWTWLLNTIAKIIDFGKRIVTTGKEKGKEFVDGTVSFFKELPGKIFGAIIGAIDKITEWGKTMKETAKEKVEDIKNSIVDGFTSLPEKISEIGSQLISGLWNGITGAGDWLKEKISGFGEGIIEGFTSVFDIHSPSRVMEKLIGNNIVYGLVKGVTEKTGDAVKAMDTFASKTMVPLDGMRANVNAGVPAYGSGGNSHTSTTNNYYSFNQTNNSPKSLSRLEIYRQTKNQINFMKARGA